MARQLPRCSFCGKSADAVERLIAGPGVFICDACVAQCVEVLDGNMTPGAVRPAPSRPAPLTRLRVRLGGWFGLLLSGGGAPASG
jgi:hypothetical protein